MNQTLPEQPLADLGPLDAVPQWRRQWPAFGYAFAITIAAMLLIPFREAGHWLTSTIANLWKGSGCMLPVFLIISGYVAYCCVLLAKRRLTPLHIDRLLLAEHSAYSAGVLGIIIRLVSLGHTAAESFDPRTVLGALEPLEIGFSLWATVMVVRWLAEHIATINSQKNSHEE